MEPSAAAQSVSPSDPPQDQCVSNVEALLHAVGVLLTYGRHLVDTIRQRATTPNFNAIAACFGTGRLFAIMAHLQRGILRATALENVLLARAARGRDIGLGAPRVPAAAAPAATLAAPAEAPVEQPAAPAELPVEAPVARKEPRPSRPVGWNDPELFMPTLAEFEAEVRRRPLGVTLVAICLDLAVAPGFCTGEFWNELFDSIRMRGGSIAVLMLEKMRREEAFAKEQDRKIGSNWDWQELTKDAMRRVLGGFIGEGADGSFDSISEPCAPAVATGPS